MNMKKVWLYSIIVALIATMFLYLLLNSIAQPERTETVEKKKENPPALAENEPSHASKLMISKEKRAMSIRVDDVQGVGGFLRPHHRVDIIIVFPDNTGKKASPPILYENIKVLAIGKIYHLNEIKEEGDKLETKEEYESVTVEVSPEQAITLAQVLRNGYITFILRSDK